MVEGDVVDDQPVWEAAADAVVGIEGDAIRAAVRLWVAQQMRDAPWRVWRREQHVASRMRPSFVVAIRHATAAIVAGAAPP